MDEKEPYPIPIFDFSSSTLPENVIVDLLHADMLFVRGLCGPSPSIKPTDEEIEDEMLSCFLEASSVLHRLSMALDLMVCEGMAPKEGLEVKLSNVIKLTRPDFSTVQLAGEYSWKAALLGNVRNIYYLTEMYLHGKETMEGLLDIATTVAYQRMVDLTNAFRLCLNIDKQVSYPMRHLLPMAQSWLTLSPYISRQARGTILSEITEITLDNIERVLPMVDLYPDAPKA